MDIRTCKIRTAAALCCCAAALAAAPAVRALFDQPQQAPAVAVFSKSDERGAVVVFSQEDFTSRLEGDDELEGIVINSLPDQQAGVLKIAGRPLLCGEGVTADGLNTLSFEPAGQEDSHASFSFIPVFADYGAGDKSVAVNINLSDQPNSAPLAQAMEFETYVDLPCSGQLEASDAEGDPMTFCLVSQPKKGSVELAEDGRFCYTPLEGKAYSEKFTYCAVDQNGNASNPASVKISVKKQSAKKTVRYADLADDPSHYAAIRLAEAGVFSGENIGGDYFLSPDETVTRAQFIAMTMSAAQVPLPTSAIPSGLADDAQTPQWAKAASAAALHAGIVSGSPDGAGSRVLRAQDPVTRAEAAVILDRAMSLPQGWAEEQLLDGDQIPSWAAVSVNSALCCGVMDAAGGQSRPNDPLTRSEAVQMLYRALSLQEKE